MSLRNYLDEIVTRATQVLVMRDGLVLSKVVKPFLTVDYLVTNVVVDAAGRTNYSETYRFQIGVFAKDNTERMRLHQEVLDAFHKPEGIPLRSATGALTNRNFVVDVSEFTPIANEDTANDTFNHHGYFTVSIEIYRDNGSKTFTQ